MDKNACHKIVRDTFQNPFDKERFLYFIKNLLNTIDESKAFHARGYVPEIYKSYVKTYERLGTYTDPEDNKIDVVVVYLQKEQSLERARTSQRNFIARYLKDRNQKDAGLVAFVSPNPDDWRFSLVKMEYKFEEGEGGTIKVKEEFTPARRWSFLVGKNENSHTAQSRLVPIVENDKFNPTLNGLEEAFNIETVTKEFFEKYRELFLWTKETLENTVKKSATIKKDFEDKNVNITDFSKKLLGQIVFLYFLQKKGWFGVGRDADWGSGPKVFLRLLFNKKLCDYSNFFNDILEPLFYEALAKERDDDFYSRFNCKIPFLNGGLFDPINDYDWIHADILLPNELFSNNYKTKDGDIGNGVLDVFDRYNFTVKEDEPLEKEVAVDPEMLGKVFENLLEVSNRKSKGTYYTPREIVHYMCEQSLINYLNIALEAKVTKEDIEILIKYGELVGENEARVKSKGEETDTYFYQLPETIRLNADAIDEKLANIKICDPAIGSGAFPVGMMSEIVRARNTLSSYLDDSRRTLYSFKRDCIQNSLYGVDIDPGAVEIAKLRLWLSLVVDEDDIKQIKPLPNLDYKIMQGNSLLEEFEGIKLFDEKLIAAPDLCNETQIESLKHRQTELQKEYFELHSENKLTAYKQAELSEELKSVAAQLKRLRYSEKVTAKTASLFDIHSEASKKANILKKLHEDFFETTQKAKKDNIRRNIEKLEWDLIETTLKEQNNISALKKLDSFKQSNTRPFFLWKLHFADVFQKQSGFDVVIANPPYVSAWSMEKENPGARSEIKNALKDYSILSGHWDLYIAFVAKGHQILTNMGSLSYIVPNPILREKYASDTRRFLLENMQLKTILEFNDKNVFENVSRRTTVLMAVKNKNKNDYPIYISGNNQNNQIRLLNKVEKQSWLRNPKHIFLVKGNSQEDSLISELELQSDKIGNFFYVNYGAQVASKEKGKFGKKEVVGTKPKNNAKQFYEGRDVQRWHLNWRGLYLDYRINELYGPRAPELFEQNKIVIRKVTDKDHKLCATFDHTKHYTDDGNVLLVPYKSLYGTCLRTDFEDYIISKENIHLKYALAIILSQMENFYFKKRFATESLQGSTSHTYPASVRGLLIKNISDSEQQPFIELVDTILLITESDNYNLSPQKQEQVKHIEEQINRMVYKMYNLTSKEIRMIENSC